METKSARDFSPFLLKGVRADLDLQFPQLFTYVLCETSHKSIPKLRSGSSEDPLEDLHHSLILCSSAKKHINNKR